jgi:hypothetical protein
MPAFDLAAIGAGLSFAGALPALQQALDNSTAVVVSAPPGTGKTTLVPPLLTNRTSGRIIVTQPRRVAARAAARRLAQLDGSPLGDRVGFTVRGERRAGPSTEVEFVTAGVLLRRMLSDPGLDGVDAVIIDEVHERALETDLLIGLLGEVRELRDDLVLIAMSATLDAERIAASSAPTAIPPPSSTTRCPRSRSKSAGRRALLLAWTSAASPGRSSTMWRRSQHPLPVTCTATTRPPTYWCSCPVRGRSPRPPAASTTPSPGSTCESCTGRSRRRSRMP